MNNNMETEEPTTETCILDRGPRKIVVLKGASGRISAAQAAELGATWRYNWQYFQLDPAGPGDGKKHVLAEDTVPMLRPCAWEEWDRNRARWVAEQNPGRVWLLGNEPTLFDQDGEPDPKRAAKKTRNMMRLVNHYDPKATFIVGGFMAMHAGHPSFPEAGAVVPAADYPVYWQEYMHWLRHFMGADGLDLGMVKGVHIHLYYRSFDPAPREWQWFADSASWVKGWVRSTWITNPELWVTEWGDLGHYAALQSTYMRGCLEWMEISGVVARHAWFVASSPIEWGGYRLLDRDGDILPLGQVYAEYAGTVEMEKELLWQ